MDPRNSAELTASRWAGIAAGAALVFSAQALFTRAPIAWLPGERLPLVGGLVLIFGALLFGLSMPWSAGRDEEERTRAGSERGRVAFAVLAVGAYAACLGIYARAGENVAVHVTWALAIVAVLAACGGQRVELPAGARAERWREIWPLALVFPAALAMRVWRLDSMPPLVLGDALFAGSQARDILAGKVTSFVSFGWAAIPMPGFLPEVVSLSVFGNDYFGVCMSAVLSGMAALAGTYLLGAELYNPRVGWLSTALLAVSYTHIHFSRVPPHIHTLPWVTFALYFLVRGERTANSRHYALAGLLAGFCFQLYYSGRVVVVLFALVAIHALLSRRFRFRSWLVVAFAFLAAVGPMAVLMVQHWDAFMERTRAVSVFSPGMMGHLQAKLGGASPLGVVLHGAKKSFLTLFHYHNVWYERDLGRPFFDGFTAPLLALGAGYACCRLRRFANWVALGSAVAIIVLGMALAGDPPSWQRATGMMPFAGVLAALPIDRCARLFRLPRRLAHPIFLIALAALGWRNWTGFVAGESVRTSALSIAARYAATIPPERELLFVGLPWPPEFADFTHFLAPRLVTRAITRDDALAGRWGKPSRPPVVMLIPEHADLLPALEATWPGGRVRELLYPNRSLALVAYEPSEPPS